jgi:hypothetical protein
MSRSHFGFKYLGSLCATKRPASTGAERLPHCNNKCGRRVRTKRSKLCSNCFGRNAVSSGARSAGNIGGNPCNARNAKGSPGNAGSARAKGSPGNAGNEQSSPGNVGNTRAKGSPGNAGNEQRSPGNAGNTSAKGLESSWSDYREGPANWQGCLARLAGKPKPQRIQIWKP